MTTFTVEQLQRMANWFYLLERTDPGLLSVEDKDTHCDLVAAITAMRLANQSADKVAASHLVRTRLWRSDEGSSTAVQFRNDLAVMVWLNTNIGWVPISNAPEDEVGAEDFAVRLANGYRLIEADKETAQRFLGLD